MCGGEARSGRKTLMLVTDKESLDDGDDAQQYEVIQLFPDQRVRETLRKPCDLEASASRRTRRTRPAWVREARLFLGTKLLDRACVCFRMSRKQAQHLSFQYTSNYYAA
jgi:hypothetical protein